MAKQGRLEGTEQPKIKELMYAIEDYVATRDARMDLLITEKAKKEVLMALMKKHKVTTYRVNGKEAEYIHDESENVKVRAIRDEPEEGEDDDD